MKSKGMVLLMLAAALAFAVQARAAGTPAGMDIVNQATATFEVSGNSFLVNSNAITIKVAELLNVSVVWQDAASVVVSTGDTSRVLTFLVTNTGNGTDEFTLAGNSALSGDDFDPTLDGLYLDANGNGTYDDGVDLQYAAGVNDPLLAADSTVTVFSLNDIPLGPVDGNTGNSNVTATSKTGTGAPGTVFGSVGDGGVDAVVGTSGAADTDLGTYVISNVQVSILKSVIVSDPFGGTEPIPGATMKYALTITVSGTATAETVVITDPLPLNTTYVAGTLTLNAGSLSDGLDLDAGDVGGTTPGTVTVNLGNLTSASPVQTITFDVLIN